MDKRLIAFLPETEADLLSGEFSKHFRFFERQRMGKKAQKLSSSTVRLSAL
jgi:hypothetical protein